MSSQKQIDANRKNAQKSTGPKSRENKDKTRFNGVKHGLRSEHAVLPGESRAEFEVERQGWADDWQPRSHTRAVLVERAAAISWKLRRSVRVETARLSTLAEAAGLRHDALDRAVVITGMARFAHDPDAALGELRAHPAGIDHLLGIADHLLDDLADLGRWIFVQPCHALLGLMGYPADTPPEAIDDEFNRSIARDAFDLLAYHDPSAPARPSEPAARAILGRLRDCVLAMRGQLLADRSRFPDAADRRSAAIDAASVDASPEGRLLHRYEMAHDRALRATVKELIALEKSGADLKGRDDETESPVATSVATTEPARSPVAPTEANPPAAARQSAPTEANFEPAEAPIGDIGRVSEGPIRRPGPSDGGRKAA